MKSNHHHPPIDSSGKVVGRNEATSWKWRSFSLRESVVGEPTSPKIGCMGQIKKEKIPTSVAKAGAGTNQKISKLKKMFSSKSFVRRTSKASSQGLMNNGDKIMAGVLPVDLPLELDPPLPVKKLGKKKSVEDVPAVSLWRRRSWIKLERLQLQNLKPRFINCPRGV